VQKPTAPTQLQTQ